MMKNKIIPVLIVLLAIALANCSKDDSEANQKGLSGTYISLDKSDTLDFTTSSDFYKSNENMHYDHYDYQRFNDSLEIRYNGMLLILVHPTMHKYSLDNDSLTIDFSNKQCFGFPMEEITYIK